VALLGALSVLAGCVAALRAVGRAPAFHGVQRGQDICRATCFVASIKCRTFGCPRTNP